MSKQAQANIDFIYKSSPEPPEMSISTNQPSISVIYSDMDEDFPSTSNNNYNGIDGYENYDRYHNKRKLKNIKYNSMVNTFNKKTHNNNEHKIKHYYKAKYNVNGDEYKLNENIKIKKSKHKRQLSMNAYNKLGRQEQRELREAFRLFDKDDDGTITIQELYSVFLGLNYNFTQTQIKKMISSVLENEDNYHRINENNCKLDINEFVMIMKGHKYHDVNNR